MNPNNASYLSTWDIDQLVASPSLSTTLGITGSSVSSVVIYSHGLSFIPTIDAQFQLVGESVWRQIGDTSTSAGANMLTFINVDANNITLYYYNYGSSRTLNIRLQIWSDKVNY